LALFTPDIPHHPCVIAEFLGGDTISLCKGGDYATIVPP